MPVLEAWSYRLLVLMTEICNLPEGIDAGVALQISPTVESIGDGLVQLAALERSELEAMGERGRKIVEENFSPERVTQQMISVYEWCLGSDRPDGVHFSGD